MQKHSLHVTQNYKTLG